MTSMMRVAQVAALFSAASAACLGSCRTNNKGVKRCTFDFSLDVFASETGYYRVKGCEGVMPELTMEADVEYTFKQTNITNWMHPLGFAYFADGAHKGVDELEPGINNGASTYCTTSENTCDAPQYYIDKAYVGRAGGDMADFGLDVYEPDYKLPRDVWSAKAYEVKLTITDPDTKDIFYFCHIHDNMSGRVKVADMNAEGVLVNRQVADLPALGYTYASHTGFDVDCGTSGVDAFKNTTKMCPDMTFLCNVEGHSNSEFGRCMEALDCAMHVGMRSEIHANPTVTFIHQMIPHHQNAVNMAKALMKTGAVGDDEDMTAMLWDIINTQNMQITAMNGWLGEKGYNADAPCDHTAPIDSAASATAGGVAATFCLVAAAMLLA